MPSIICLDTWLIALSKLCHVPQVFFIRDGMKFVDLNHALKPNPKTSEFAT